MYGVTMRTILYFSIIISYSITQILKVVQFYGRTEVFLASIVSVVVFSTASYFTWKKVPVFRFITSSYLAFAGLFMLPLSISPVVDSVALRILFVIMGLFWLASSIWILKKYSVK
jgi:hypothetical protein